MPKIAGMIGTDANTGKPLGGIEHLRQSIRDILATPLGSRVMRRDYGSRVPNLIDAPMNRTTLLGIYAAAADAIGRWEPRLRLSGIKIEAAEPGQVTLNVTGRYLPEGREITIGGVQV